MRAVKSRDTTPELALRGALSAAGVRGYRLHRKNLPGRPDIAFGRARLAVFVDGAFWHGHESKPLPATNRNYWKAKIDRNVARDRAADASLAAMGWTVIRIWDFEVRQDADTPAEAIKRLLASPGALADPESPAI